MGLEALRLRLPHISYAILKPMKGGDQPRGFTIIEVMIFLAVSGLLFASAMTLIISQNSRTEFIQSTREFESRILDIINDVAVGYYPTNRQIKCDANLPIGSGITLSESPVGVPIPQGTNSGCTFIGLVVQFAPQGSDGRNIRAYTIAGQRLKTASPLVEVTNIEMAQGKAIAKESAVDTAPDVFQDINVGPIRIGKVIYQQGAAVTETGGVGFFTTFKGYTAGSLDSGTTSAVLAPLPPIPTSSSFTIDQVPTDFVYNLNRLLPDTNFKNSFNPSDGVTICLLSLGTSQHALLKIGGDSRQLTTQLTFHGGNDIADCPS